MSPLLYHVVHFTTGLHHTAVILHILFIATFNTNSVQSFNSSCIRAVFLTATKVVSEFIVTLAAGLRLLYPIVNEAAKPSCKNLSLILEQGPYPI
jgi:hypothetical protein